MWPIGEGLGVTESRQGKGAGRGLLGLRWLNGPPNRGQRYYHLGHIRVRHWKSLHGVSACDTPTRAHTHFFEVIGTHLLSLLFSHLHSKKTLQDRQ